MLCALIFQCGHQREMIWTSVISFTQSTALYSYCPHDHSRHIGRMRNQSVYSSHRSLSDCLAVSAPGFSYYCCQACVTRYKGAELELLPSCPIYRRIIAAVCTFACKMVWNHLPYHQWSNHAPRTHSWYLLSQRTAGESFVVVSIFRSLW